LAAKLAEICGDARLSASLRPLLVTAYDTNKRQVRIFRGGPPYRHSDPDYRLKDVLRATTAAPSIFPPARIASLGRTQQETLIDGGIYANNPSLLARAEAQRLAPGRPLLLVSIGTGQDTSSYGYHRIRGWGYSGWLNPWRSIPLLQLVMTSQSEFTHQFLAGQEPDPRRYVRLNLSLPAADIVMDDSSPANLRRIEALADQLIERHTAELDALAEALADG
jgi:predicted acylesterase/phospholipase RssA